MKLRPYQQEAVNAAYQHLRERDDNPCIVLPTGTGKSLVLAQIATDAVVQWSGRVLILAHVKELLEQNAEKIQALCPDIRVGIYSAGLGRQDTAHNVIVAGIQSVYKKACELGKFDIIVIDEAHLIPEEGEGMYRKFLADAKIINPLIRVIGLTATPFRLRGGRICKPKNILNHVCYEAGIKEMIVNGYLSPLKTKAGQTKPILTNLHVRAGEFVAADVKDAMDRMSITSEAVKEVIEYTKDRKAVLIFTCSVEHCKHVAEEIGKHNLECGIVTAKTGDNERAELLSRFKGKKVKTSLFGEEKGPLKFLANVNVLTTGFDAPNVDCVVLLRPTASAGLYVQMIGRGTRIYPGKQDCLILDYGENVLRHGPIDMINVSEPDKKTGSGGAVTKECPECHSLIHSSYRYCPECNYEFKIEERAGINSTAGKESVLSGEIEDITYTVLSVSHDIHTKKGADDNAPKTMKIEYRVGLNNYIREWVCPEHTGWARSKFAAWWKDRTDAPVPASAQEAVEIAWSGVLCETEEIVVRSISGEPFDRVIDYKLGEKPEYREPGWDDVGEEEQSSFQPANAFDWNDESWIDDIPF